MSNEVLITGVEQSLSASKGIDPRPTAWFLSQGTPEAKDMRRLIERTGMIVEVFETPDDLPRPELSKNWRDDGDHVTWYDEKVPHCNGSTPDLIIGTGLLALHPVLDTEGFRRYDGKGLAKLWDIPYLNVGSSLLQLFRAEYMKKPSPIFCSEAKVEARLRRVLNRVIKTKLAA